MSSDRLRAGELLAVAGAVGLLVMLFLDWFAVGGAGGVPTEPLDERTTGWSTLGWAADALVVVTVLATGWLVVATASRRLVSTAVAIGVVTVVAASATAVVLAVRLLVDRPGLGLGLPDGLVDVRAPAWLGLAAAAVLALGAWLSLRDERDDARENAVVAPSPRAAPPA